ncbi:PIN domain-containing protein [Mucilaginibacter auburnensis]|uniref:Glycosyl transferase family 8 n=1 Tax=Mucilaginibacter auburnensis TaxID=1457233 RepID=A0A2H9VMB0_9SPHI|nr:PIN domain-containing protein [Mucilaginibacter auburnensis]PJJ79454.1 hypothetical protein CLV57_2588 [Mucilaginibacter auburnensis]
MNNRNVVTLATGKPVYLDYAVNLAFSFLHWHPQSDIKFYLVTDIPELVPQALASKISVIKINKGELGTGFSPKLQLDKFAPPGQTLFIDSDCLIFGSIEGLFKKFSGNAVSVVGGYISAGEWFGDITAILKKYDLKQMPKFNGGIYYIENGDDAKKVYETARSLEKQYDEIGFVRLRNSPNDEVLMALAMELHGQKPLTDDGTIMSDPQACQGGYTIDVLNGKCTLINPPAPHPLHQAWYPFEKVSPLVIHFLGYYTQHYPYRLEVFKLRKNAEGKLNALNRLTAKFTIAYPEIIKTRFKGLFRPLYRLLFGVRKPTTSPRV